MLLLLVNRIVSQARTRMSEEWTAVRIVQQGIMQIQQDLHHVHSVLRGHSVLTPHRPLLRVLLESFLRLERHRAPHVLREVYVVEDLLQCVVLENM